MWEIIQGTGSLVGFATGLFVLREWLTKHNPTAFLSVETYANGARDLRLTLVNPSDRPVIVETKTGSDDGKFGVAKDTTIEAIGDAIVRGNLAFLLDGRETRTLAVFMPVNYDDLAPQDPIKLRIDWRFAQGKRQPVKWPLSISVKKRDVQIMLDELPSGPAA